MPSVSRIFTLAVDDLPKTDTFKWSDPYIKIQKVGDGNNEDETIYKTEVRENTAKATYEPKELSIDSEATYYFQVLDEDRGREDDFVGKTDFISGQDLIDMKPEVVNPKICNFYKQTTKDQKGEEREIRGLKLLAEGSDFIEKDFNDPDEFTKEAVPRIELRVDKKSMWLAVQASDLASEDMMMNDDYYFTAQIVEEKSDKFYESEIISDAKAVKKFKKFELEYTSELDSLKIDFYDKDNIGSDYIGGVVFKIRQITDDGQHMDILTKQRTGSFMSCLCGAAEKLGKDMNRGNIKITMVDEEFTVNKDSKKPECQAADYEPVGKNETTATDVFKDASISKGGYHGDIYIGGININIGQHKVRDIHVNETSIYTRNNEVLTPEEIENGVRGPIGDVCIIDKTFKAEEALTSRKFSKLGRSSKYHVENDVRKYDIKLNKKGSSDEVKKARGLIENNHKKNESLREQWKNDQNAVDTSFAYPTKNSKCRWFSQGRDYFHYLCHIIENAKYEIYITDWWFTPEILLKRPAQNDADADKYRLHNMLKKKAEEDGVNVYLQLFDGTGARMLGLGNDRVTNLFNDECDRFQVMGHSAGLKDLYLWSHHEKIVVVDQTIAFVGGMDLCIGRFDDERYNLFDATKAELFELDDEDGSSEGKEYPHGESGRLWQDKDYNNSMTHTVVEPQAYIGQDNFDRKTRHRGPWQDIGSVVYGKAAFDLGRHFIDRWNFTKKQSKHDDNFDEWSELKYLLPIPNDVLKERIEQLEGDDNLLVPPEEAHRPYEDKYGQKEPFNILAQPLRSLCLWSGGLGQTEHSIQDAYGKLISEAEDFVYIENQFFCTTVQDDSDGKLKKGNDHIQNNIGTYIVKRIVKAHEEKKKFKIYFVIPLMPEGEIDVNTFDSKTTKTIMYFQYYGICRDSEGKENLSIYTYLKNKGINPDDYMSWCGLRAAQYVKYKDQVKMATESIYVHSKLCIADDKRVIIGSANLNDRSQKGDGDSEVCVLYTDEEKKFGKSLREYLWGNYMKKDKDQLEALGCPSGDDMFNEWNRIKNYNSQTLDEVFKTVPQNKIHSWDHLAEYVKDEYPNRLQVTDKEDACKKIDSLEGVLVEYPLDFMKDVGDTFHPSALGAPESLAPIKTFI